jgi:hypothetical protein
MKYDETLPKGTYPLPDELNSNIKLTDFLSTEVKLIISGLYLRLRLKAEEYDLRNRKSLVNQYFSKWGLTPSIILICKFILSVYFIQKLNKYSKKACFTLVGTIYPLFNTLKFCLLPDPWQQSQWLSYWFLFGSLNLLNLNSELIGHFFPMYHWIQLIGLYWFQTYNNSGELRIHQFVKHLPKLVLLNGNGEGYKLNSIEGLRRNSSGYFYLSDRNNNNNLSNSTEEGQGDLEHGESESLSNSRISLPIRPPSSLSQSTADSGQFNTHHHHLTMHHLHSDHDGHNNALESSIWNEEAS